ncbi:hypothetical protein, partial [Stenotrophomonas sp. 3diitr2024]|uniref:hypothetical protein n=1 Tax=Stenotrophomonas sp. 3diitr2024 TaxID=3345115 RepID=UPI0035CBDEDA
IEEDREQLFDEAHRLQLDPAAMKQVGQLSDATAHLRRRRVAAANCIRNRARPCASRRSAAAPSR